MVLNVKQYKSLSVAENLSRTQAEQAEILNRHPSNKQGVSLSFPESMDHFPCPELGPLTEKGENELESYNRCWELLRYIASGFYKANWKNRFATTEAVQNVRQSFTSDQLPPIEVKVHWEHNAEVAEYDQTVLAIKKARSQKFRDSIRRSLNCQALGLDLQMLCVIYHCEDGNRDEQANGLSQDWKTVRGVFEDPNNSNFILEVRMEPFDTEDVMYPLYEDDSDPITYLAIQTFQNKNQQIHRQVTSTGPEESSGITEKTPQQAAEKETAGAA
ncbi:hypothetical protein N7501_005112 [Penicillium viridicatum]|nr:hypothetical protein N7501_005112 [Penicillium viridicatum]